MELKKSTVQDSKSKESFDYEYNSPSDLKEAIKMWGKAVCEELFFAAVKVKVDNIARNMFVKGKTRADVEKYLETYVPGAARKSKEKTVADMMSEKADLIQASGKFTDVVELFVNKKYDECIELLNSLK